MKSNSSLSFDGISIPIKKSFDYIPEGKSELSEHKQNSTPSLLERNPFDIWNDPSLSKSNGEKGDDKTGKFEKFICR
jgi:hypothetical protein